ncbi:MAG: pyridoxamine 5'-phosphate oxidase family protein [Rhodothalassiaceae bacterium]
MADQTDKTKLWDLVERLRIGMMTTRDEGVLRSRPMLAIVDRGNDELWFFTRQEHHQTSEVAEMADVNIAFADATEQLYVSISGEAEVLNDHGRAKQLWIDDLAPWFPDGPEDANLRLIRVHVRVAEYWDKQISDMARLWQAAATTLSDRPGDVENRKLNVRG